MEILQMDPHPRGLALEPFLRDLFDAFDLNPKASFRITGEQIDGGFSLDMEHFLLEAKWENVPADRAALDIFATKVDRKAENTLGLFVAIRLRADRRRDPLRAPLPADLDGWC